MKIHPCLNKTNDYGPTNAQYIINGQLGAKSGRKLNILIILLPEGGGKTIDS